MRKFDFGPGRKTVLRGTVSLVALCALGATLGVAGQALAQTAKSAPSDDTVDEVVVVGVRKSLESAQNIKKNADTVVDSITATDIGAFPDKSVAEALQRVPGITVSRLQSSDDSSHFSAEPASVLIRGLTQVRTEFNGRDSFSADANRGLNFNDISPELMAGVDSYKNQTADMIEGGIAGTVNLRTRLPFDTKDQVISVTGKANYGDKSEKVTYEYSGIITKNWDTQIGRIGLMANYANSHVLTQTEGVVMQRLGTFCSAGYQDASGKPIVKSDGTIACTANPYGGSSWVFIPDQVNYSQVVYDRKRHGTALAFQYENNAGNVRFSAQYNDSYYKNAWLERSVNVVGFGLWASPAFSPQTTAFLAPAAGTPAFTFGADGMLTSGVLTQPTGDWGGSTADNIARGSAVAGLPFVNYCGAGAPACASQREGLYIENQARNFNHSEGTKDFSMHLDWDVSDKLRTSFDSQYIKADTNNYDILVANRTMADAKYEVNKDGTPKITLLPGSNVNAAPGGLANPHNYWIPFIQDHYEDNDAKELALRADAEYSFGGGGWLNSLKVGVRYADRKQNVRYSTYNWSPVAAPWNCNGPGFNIDNTTPTPYPAACGRTDTFQGYGKGIWTTTGLGDFYNGDVFPNGDMVFLSKDTLADHDGLIKALSGKTTNSPMQWTPLCERASNTEGCFIAPEMLKVREKTTAAYAMLRFGGQDTTIFDGITVQGNVGLRYVHTDVSSSGGVAYPVSTWYTTAAAIPCSTPLSGNNVTNISCWLKPELLAFSNGGSALNDYGQKHDNWLPSFNVRFGLTDKQFVRFAASRALSRPDFGLLRNFVGVQSPAINTGPDSPYIVWKDPAGAHTAANVAGYNFQFNADSGYAALKPITADQFDVTYENYFTPSSSFTAALFYKKLNGSIAYGEFLRSFTNNGSTQNVLVRGPRNGNGGGELKGFELAYQTFFDFLPGIWSGLGFQANWTHTKQSGISNSNLANQPGYAAGGTIAFGGGLQVNGQVMDSHRLAGISDNAYNIVGLYEKGPLAMRLAYNWRSSFLTNNLDCCIGMPIYQKAAGYLDGSIRWSVNSKVEVSLEGSNLLNTTSVFQQQVFGDTGLTPNAAVVKKDTGWIRNDRRVQFGVRVKY